MTAEWLYPPGVGPLCGAELEAWYEDLQDILGSDAGGAKLSRAPPSAEKEPEFLDVLESCSLTWLTEGQVWGDGVQRVADEIHPNSPSPPPPPSSSSSSSSSRPEERRSSSSSDPDHSSSSGDLLPPEFFELLSEGGVGPAEAMVGFHLHGSSSPAASEEEELPTVPDTSSCSSPSVNCSPPASPPSRKRKRGGEKLSCNASPGKKSRREREQENERRVQELTDQNERLKAEIERLGEEVQRTRRALIERLVNTRR